MKPIRTPPATRLQPAPRGRETLLQLVSDLVRRSWLRVDASHYLDDYEGSQWLTPTPLRELQLAKLRRLTWHCFLHVPYYAQHLGNVLQPSRIERLERLDELPMVRWEARADDAAFTTTTNEPLADEARTAGRRGTPRRVRIDVDCFERRTAVRRRNERWAGAPPAQVVAAWGRESTRAPRALDGAEVGALMTAIERARPSLVTGPAAALDELARALDAAPPTLRDRVRQRLFGQGRRHVTGVIVRGEDAGAGGARLAERTGARLTHFYAAAEVGVVAATCDRAPSPTAMHVNADHLLVEIVDGRGQPAPPGAEGRVLVTDLHNYAAPYLRYELGDVGRLLPHGCPCGRSLPLVEVTGRI